MTSTLTVNTRLTGDPSGVIKAAKEAGGALDGMKSAVRTAGNVMKSAGEAASVAFSAATATLVGLGTQAFFASARVQELDTVIEAVAGSTGIAAEEIRAAADALRDQGIEAAAAKEMALQFARANLNLADASKIARVAQDLAVVSGQNSTETAMQLMYAVSEQSTQLLQSAGIVKSVSQGYDEYARSLGKTVAQLTPVEKQQAIVNLILEEGARVTGVYEASMTSASKVIRSFPRILNDISVELGGPLVEALGPVIVETYNMTKAFSQLFREGGALRPVIDAIGTALTTITTPFAEAIAKVTEGIKGFQGIADAGSKVNEVFAKLKEFAPGLGAIAAAMVAIGGSSFAAALGPLGAILPTLNPVVAAFAALVAFTPELREALMGVAQAAMPILEAFKPLVPLVLEVIGRIGEILGGALVALLPTITKAFGLLAGVIGDTLAVVLPLVMPLLESLGTVLMTVLEAIMPLIDTGLSVLAALLPVLTPLLTAILMPLKILAPVLEALAPLFEIVGKVLGLILSPLDMLIPYLEGAANWFGELMGEAEGVEGSLGPIADVLAVVKDALQGFADWITPENLFAGLAIIGEWLYSTFVQPVVDAWNQVVAIITWTQEQIGLFVAGVMAFFQPFIAWFQANVAPVFVAAGNLIAKVMNYLGSVVAWVWGGIVEAITAAVLWINENVAQPIADVVGQVIAFFTKLQTTAQGIWNDIVATIAGAVATAWAWIVDTFSPVVQWMSDTFSPIVDTISGIWDAVVGTFTDLYDGIMGFFSDAGKWLLQAGEDIINGLIAGIEGALGWLTDTLNNITNMIPEAKGPPERDAVLLRDNGRLIMQSLMDGIRQEIPALLDTLSGVTASISPNVTQQIGPEALNRGLSVAAMPQGNGDTIIKIEVTTNGNVDVDELTDKIAGKVRFALAGG